MKHDLTSGSVKRAMFYFALPYLLSYFLQTLYGMADLFVIGQFYGVSEITAVSNGSQVMYMTTVIIVGLAMGATVLIGNYTGAKEKDKTSDVVGNTATFFLLGSLILMAVLLLFRYPITNALGVPTESVEGCVSYLTITFIGIPFITAYNIISSIYRGLGDSKTPMYFVAIACFINILLDYVLIGGCHLGPAGAAYATVIAQTTSVIIALFSIVKKDTGISLKKSNFKLKKTVLKKLLSIGLPVAIQDGCIQVSFLLIMIIANYRGVDDAAAVGVVEKIIGLAFIVPSSMLATVSTLTSQSIGANKKERGEKTLAYALVVTVTYGILISILTLLFKEQIVGLFSDDKNVVLLGSQYISSYIFDCIFAGIHFCFTGYFCAYGKSYIGFIHNIVAIVLLRVPGAYFLSKWYPNTLFPMGLAAPAGSIISVVICLIAYACMTRSKKSAFSKN